MNKRVKGVGVAVLSGVSAVSAFGQCGQWEPIESEVQRIGTTLGLTRAFTSWDADGPGPQQPRLVAGGNLFASNNIAMWTGSSWAQFGNGLNAAVFAVTAWDPHGAGPSTPLLIAGGFFTNSGGSSVPRIARWNGGAWVALGGGTDQTVNALTTWDPDGSGPLGEQLIAAGDFTLAGATAANHIARWDGSQWVALGSGVDDSVFALTTWDPDGSGPMGTMLFAAGEFQNAGGAPASLIAMWDGSAWHPLGAGLAGTRVYTLTTWDPDGAGPQGTRLYAGGPIFGVPATQWVVSWNGTTWAGTGAGAPSATKSLSTFDPDGPGPLGVQLISGGDQGGGGRGIKRWDGVSWQDFDPTAPITGVQVVVPFDLDGPGALMPYLLAGGSFSSLSDTESAGYVAKFDGVSWEPFASGVSDPVRALTPWDPDGAGPQAALLCAGGSFAAANDVSVGSVAQLAHGGSWQPMAVGFNAGVHCMTTIDPDGTGPLETELIAAGDMTLSGATALARVARWDGAAWQAQGTGVNDTVLAMTAFDPDSTAPIPERLTLAGEFENAANGNGDHVVRWNGTTWQNLGSGVPGAAMSLVVWDRDGAGPLGAELFVGGDFNEGIFEFDDYIRRWNGASWAESAGGLNNDVLALTTWDPDGAGPLGEQLIAGGEFSLANAQSVNGVARWDGLQWHALGTGLAGGSAAAYALATLDVDGPGPQAALLIVGGSFETAGGITVNNIASWDGTSWQAMGEGVNGAVRAMTLWDSDGAGAGIEELVIGGDFEKYGFSSARYLLRWSNEIPVFTEQPMDVILLRGSLVSLSAGVDVEATAQWRRNGVDLVNGFTGIGSIISGATTFDLTISNAQVADSGDYELVATGLCGDSTSAVAVVTINPPAPSCPGDTNGDDSVNGADLSVLLAQFGQSVTPWSGADFNGDGIVNGADLSVLLGLFGTAC